MLIANTREEQIARGTITILYADRCLFHYHDFHMESHAPFLLAPIQAHTKWYFETRSYFPID